MNGHHQVERCRLFPCEPVEMIEHLRVDQRVHHGNQQHFRLETLGALHQDVAAIKKSRASWQAVQGGCRDTTEAAGV